jgi:hypothetical protein
MVAVNAPQRAPARRPVPAPAPRHLRVVERERTRRFPPPTILTVLGAGVLFAVLFALAAFHTVLVSGQERLDRLEEQVTEEQDRYQHLRLDVARLEAPGRIVAEATGRLGMVPAPATTYLTPSGQAGADVAAAAGAADDVAAAAEADAEAAGSDWAEVKPYLTEAP